jgi:hypothetical protein
MPAYMPGPAGGPARPLHGRRCAASNRRLTTMAHRRNSEVPDPRAATGSVETELNPYLPDLGNRRAHTGRNVQSRWSNHDHSVSEGGLEPPCPVTGTSTSS